MTYITLQNISKSFGEKILLKDITFSIEQGQKVALVAKNGSGKTTLLKILLGFEPADKGNVIKKVGLRIGYLDQSPVFNSSDTILDAVLNSDSEVIKAVKNYEDSLLDPNNMDQMQTAFEVMDKLNAWEFDTLLRDILANLKFDNLTEKVSNLSGGQIKRLAIAKLLIDPFDLIILDEPTNHLDVEIIDWLETFLSQKNITLLMVTHDRYFLDRVCNSIIELENGNLYSYKGNYSSFLIKKEERESNELISAKKIAQNLKKESEWVNKMPQGRGSKSVLRSSNYYKDLEDNKNIKSYINERSKRIEINVKNTRLGNKIVEFNNVDKAFGDKVILKKFTYVFKQHEKLGIIGANGVGKSTFLNLIMGIDKPDSGFITYGETIEFGYYDQNAKNLDSFKSIIDTIKEITEYITLADGSKATASQLLEKFLFPPKVQHKKVETLSGGEKRRLYLLAVILKNPNFLILDEPTNDFDLATLNLLEEFLINYKGCLIIVSHDRYFMDLIVDHLFLFEGNGNIVDIPGNYSYYLEHKRQDIKIVNKEKQTSVSTNDLKQLENKIKKLEQKKLDLSNLIDTVSDYEKIKKISEEIKLVNDQIEILTEQWLELSQ